MNQYHDKDDSTLVQMTLLGDKSAFEELVIRHQRAVKGTALKVTNSQFSADDASQDAFVSAWMNLSALREREKFGMWVCSIAKNHARTLEAHYRSTIPSISLNEFENYDIPDMDDEPFQYDDLHEKVEALSEKIRETVKLHYFSDLSIKEIAIKLSISEGTVKWRLSEGRKQLRKGYGIMEKTYIENESVVARVMRQVEALKLWQIKDDKSGFEAEYKAVLDLVNELPDSKEKSHALADTLLLGAWWIPGQKNDEVYAKIKQAALDGHNDDVMVSVAGNEAFKIRDTVKRIDFMLNTQVKYFEEHNFPKALAYVWFWAGRGYVELTEFEKALDCFNRVLSIVPPTNVYYANAKAAIEVETCHFEAEKNKSALSTSANATGEVYKYIDGKLYFWEQPGYGFGHGLCDPCLFWNCSPIDGLIYNPDLKPGESYTSSNGMNTVTFVEENAVCDTPAGHFDNCTVYEFKGDFYGLTYSKTYFSYGVGLVKQEVSRNALTNNIWVISKYNVLGGEGIIPFAPGNRWYYELESSSDAIICERFKCFEVTAFENNAATVASMTFIKNIEYNDTWEGKILEARQCYAKETADGQECLVDVSEAMSRAEELATSKRQKVHTAIAKDVMQRIFNTDAIINPNYTDLGRWNFFEAIDAVRKDEEIVLCDNREYSFEWKETRGLTTEVDGFQMLYSFMYAIISDGLGCIWSDKWVDGFSFKEKKRGKITIKNFEVKSGETIETPTGVFENCRHISFELSGYYAGYFNGKSEYWFADGVGIVKFRHPYADDKITVWNLTEYKGTGEGFFPIDDGLYRCYQPENLGDNWNAKVEFTFDTDETGTVIYRNATGTQDRADYEKIKTE